MKAKLTPLNIEKSHTEGKGLSYGKSVFKEDCVMIPILEEKALLCYMEAFGSEPVLTLNYGSLPKRTDITRRSEGAQ